MAKHRQETNWFMWLMLIVLIFFWGGLCIMGWDFFQPFFQFLKAVFNV